MRQCCFRCGLYKIILALGLIAALDKQFGWKSTESNVTALLYTNQKKFMHTKPDRSANRPVTWSLK